MGIDMTKGNITKNIVLFSLPVFGGSVLQNLYNVVDTIIVGRILGKEALSVVGNNFIPMLLVNSVILGCSYGITILTSQYFGKKELCGIRKLITAIYKLVLILSIILIIYGFITSKHMFKWMQIPNEIYGNTVLFFKITSLGFPFIISYNFFSAILKGIGEAKISLYVLILSSVINIFSDCFFIIILNTGILGAAYGTIFAQVCASVCMYIYFLYNCKENNIKPAKSSLSEQWHNIFMIFSYGMTSIMQNSFSAVSMIIIQGIVNTYGVVAIAAFSSAYKLESLLTVPAVSLGNALSVFVGQNWGAKKQDRIKKGLHSTLRIAILLFFVVNTVIILFGKELFYIIIGKEIEVISLGMVYLNIYGLSYVFLTLLYL